MNRLVEEFNQTVGMKKGIIINVTGMSNASHIGKKLLDAQAGKPDAGEMPDLFFGHKSNAVEIGTENLVDWKELFPKKSLPDLYPNFCLTAKKTENSMFSPLRNPPFFCSFRAVSLNAFQKIRTLHMKAFPIGTFF